jgi:hypothetical protein
MRQHAEVEAIAAFLDGRLGGEERERVVSHLADCDDCYGLLVDAARLVREEEATGDGATSDVGDGATTAAADPAGRLLRPERARWRRRALGGAVLAAAAALVLLVAAPIARYLGPPAQPPTVAELSAHLAPAAAAPFVASGWEAHGWSISRGLDEPLTDEEVRAFQVGVRVVEMDLALAAGDRALAEKLTHDLEDRLHGLDPLLTLYADEVGIRGRLATGAPQAELLQLNRQADGLLAPNESEDHPGFVDGFWYGLGKWAGAARLAAASGRPEFFADRSNRRFLRQATKRPAPEAVAARLERLDRLIRDRPAAPLGEIEDQVDELITVAGGGTPPDGAS